MGSWILLPVVVALGFLTARAVWPAPRVWSAADPVRLALAPVPGFGIASCLFFLLRIVLRQAPAVAIGAVIAVCAGLGALAWFRAASASPDAPAPAGRAPLWLSILLGAAVAMAFLTYLMIHTAAPHGEWDSWTIWTLRARFLFRAQEFVSPFSSVIDWSHPDYPLLIPGAIALLWHAGGGECTGIAGAIGMLFLLSSVAVPFFAIRLLRGPVLAAVCAIAILGAASLTRIGASLYADVPLAAAIVAAAMLLVYGLETEEAGSGPLLLAGLAAGFAGWTKNEGLLFCAILPVAFLLSVSGLPELRRRVRSLVPLLAGMIAVVAVIGLFKTGMAPQNDLVNASKTALFRARIVDFERFWATFWAFAGDFLTFGNALIPPVIVFAVWLALVRFRSPLTGAARLPLFTVTLQLIGYFFIYVLTSDSLDWQLRTSLPRLLLQVWPLAVTGIFLISGDIRAEPARAIRTSK